MDTDLLDGHAAGRYIGGTKPVSRQTLAKWRMIGTGPTYVKFGRHVRYRRSDLDAWLATQTRSNTSQRAA